jgi:DNA-binding NtrC family response regulator
MKSRLVSRPGGFFHGRAGFAGLSPTRTCLVKEPLTFLLSPEDGHGGIVEWSSSMARMSPHAPISRASRRRLARWLVGSPIRDVERDLVLETLANTSGNRTETARLLGVSIRTLRNRITEYAADGIEVPRHETPSAP